MRDCAENKGSSQPAAARQVRVTGREPSGESGSILDLLYSSDSEDESHVNRISITDRQWRQIPISTGGVPANGVIDMGAEITIIERQLFAKVAAASHIRKKDFHKADKVPRTYDGKTFHLDGCTDLDISFTDKTEYVKADALLLSEGVCRQLGILAYHGSVQPQKAKRR